jgi:hypothetical protein
MVKTFSDNLEPIQIELIDRDGKTITKTGRFLSNDDCKEISRKYKDLKGDKTGEKAFTVLQEQMAYIFGGEAKDYGKYSPSLLKNALNYVTQQVINPTPKVQEKAKK